MNVLVTAKSFCKSSALCQELAERLPSARVRFCPEWENLSREDREIKGKQVTHWLVGREIVDGEVCDFMPELQVVSKYGVGVDNVNQDALLKRGICLHCEQGVNADAVAEHTIGDDTGADAKHR